MSAVMPPVRLTPMDLERASERDGKRDEPIDGELKRNPLGFESLFVATRIAEHLNRHFFPGVGAAAVGVTVYCFGRPDHGRKPHMVFVRMDRLPDARIPKGDLHLAPDLVVEIVSDRETGIEHFGKLDEYLGAGISMVWVANPGRRTIRIYRIDDTTKLFRGQDVIENEPLLPGFRMALRDIFPDSSR